MSNHAKEAPHPADLLNGPTKVVSFKARADHLDTVAALAAERGMGIGQAHREAIALWIGVDDLGDPTSAPDLRIAA